MPKQLIIVPLLFSVIGTVNANDPIEKIFLNYPKVAGTLSVVLSGAMAYTSLTTDLKTEQHIANTGFSIFYMTGAYLFFSESKNKIINKK